jgi:hypothetical protein
MQGIVKTIVATGIAQFDMDAGTALRSGLLTGENGIKWFAEWATKSPTDRVYAYTFGGIFGGFIYNEVADFNALAEFAEGANDTAALIWRDYLADVELDAEMAAAAQACRASRSTRTR